MLTRWTGIYWAGNIVQRGGIFGHLRLQPLYAPRGAANRRLLLRLRDGVSIIATALHIFVGLGRGGWCWGHFLDGADHGVLSIVPVRRLRDLPA